MKTTRFCPAQLYRLLLLVIGGFLFHPVLLKAQTNIALHKPARQSSDYVDYSGASNAVDGNTYGYWTGRGTTITHTLGEIGPWWEVDLENVYEIQEIKIWNRVDPCCWNRLQNFYIIVSETPITSNNPVVGGGQMYIGPISFTSEQEAAKSTAIHSRGRYVRIFIPDRSPGLSLAEVEVFSDLSEPDLTEPVRWNIGDTTFGGIIFWVDDTGTRGLVAALADQEFTIEWTGGDFPVHGDGIGAGFTNTLRIVALGGPNVSPYGVMGAALRCAELTVTDPGGTEYGGWYLPSPYELNLLYTNLHMTGHGGFSPAIYSSSSIKIYYKLNGTTDYISGFQDFDDGQQRFDRDFELRGIPIRVRAVRAF